MKKLILLAALAAIMSGCKTQIVAEKHPEVITPIQRVVEVGGTNQVITIDAIISSGGWYAKASSPIFAAEALKGLDLGIATNGTVYLRCDSYQRDYSTNAVVMVHNITELVADVAGKVTGAIVAYYGGGAVSATSSLGALTVKEIYGKVQAKVAQKGYTDANACCADTEAIAKEVCADCCKDCEDAK